MDGSSVCDRKSWGCLLRSLLAMEGSAISLPEEKTMGHVERQQRQRKSEKW